MTKQAKLLRSEKAWRAKDDALEEKFTRGTGLGRTRAGKPESKLGRQRDGKFKKELAENHLWEVKLKQVEDEKTDELAKKQQSSSQTEGGGQEERRVKAKRVRWKRERMEEESRDGKESKAGQQVSPPPVQTWSSSPCLLMFQDNIKDSAL